MSMKNIRPAGSVCLALALGTLLLYFPAFHFDFVGFDDPVYVVNNPHVNHGVQGGEMGWYFGDSYAGNWHPLTWISHAVDCQVFGLHAGGHHATNVLLHIANTVLLFLVLFELTSALWRSAMVAALFAWHPLHVESVAYIAERKDVLSAFFFFLTLLAYIRYARGKKLFYLLALALFALGLMSKPMLVTLPCVLLLLDFWPLQRMAGAQAKFEPRRLTRLLLEKIPFFLLSIGSCIITIQAQERAGSIDIPIKARVVNAEMTYWHYLQHTVWPSDLGATYPFIYHYDKIALGVIGLILLGITAAALRFWRGRPYWPVGWLWFVGMLVPVVDLFHAGAFAMADRYMYLPSIGLFILICWDACDLSARWPQRQIILGCLGAVILAACLTVSSRQLQYWRNEETLVAHIAEPKSNTVAHAAYAYWLMNHNRFPEAEAECRAAMQTTSTPQLHAFMLGQILRKEGKLPEAEKGLRSTLEKYPQMQALHMALGEVYMDEAKPVQAAPEFDMVLAAFPKDPEAHWWHGNALMETGDILNAAREFASALAIRRDYPNALNDLAWILATDPHPQLHDPTNAVKMAEFACKLTANAEPQMLGTLAAAYASVGRFDDAAARAQQAHDIAVTRGLTNIAEENLRLEELYKAHRAFRE